MTTIRQDDLVGSIADALQFISYYHPKDFIAHLARAYEREQSPAAKDAIAQILTNSRMCAEGHRPICQDTGIVNVYLKIGMDVRWDGFKGSIADAVNEGVRRAYTNPENPLRSSVLADPLFARKNTKDNTPAVVPMEVVPGNKLEVTVAAKGGGSEAKSKFAMLNPSDSVVDWVLKTVPTMGAGWCPPGMLGIGVGALPEMTVPMWIGGRDGGAISISTSTPASAALQNRQHFSALKSASARGRWSVEVQWSNLSRSGSATTARTRKKDLGMALSTLSHA